MKNHLRPQRGFSRVDLLAAIAAVSVVLTVSAVSLDGADTRKRSIRDGVQQTQIHKAWITFASQFKGKLPRPGLIDRQPFNGQEIPGVGQEDVTRNTTADLYPCCIAQNYISPAIVISPLERNPMVSVKDDYNFDDYDPINDTFWDESFKADLTDESHVSFAHLPIFGKRAELHWNDMPMGKWVILSSRGPKDGQRDHESLTCDGFGFWSGQVTFADNHVELWRKPTVDERGVRGIEPAPDNIFEDRDGSDMLSTFTSSVTEQDFETQFD